ncbi:MAG: sodium:proton antiporter NhaD [Rhodospirillales bacterium]|jgi:NhaD family Na+/H+ antiporter|nr:sodium:proton antiporter NhaD [Rhodospirillales bacterium]MBT4627086.1 sodium:proton antiporter NhaD [Rhodospirillales bacterium]MBT5350638.1 sodium:proton antiporter NhaD [Rhodospirillales bacterium]MBT5521495.1 sodium:proton antiporter NhaD [Rhodospirillales bacterium]MBT6109642.1 sodium:proton antiporter NhaD [Rhodospirillales bacterium]
MTWFSRLFSIFSVLVLAPSMALASVDAETLDLTTSPWGYLCIAIFVIAYLFVMTEEVTHLRKSKPVILSAGLIWAIIGYIYASNGLTYQAEAAVRHNILEYAELFLFLLVAMTYINAMEERNVFEALRSWLVRKGYGFRQLFWMTGILAFFISPIADNLTTALLMCAVVLAVGGTNKPFVAIACINIVVAANAGGAFSPFGDITTLMVWQKGILGFFEFFALFVPSVVNFLVPAAIMHFFVPNEHPAPNDEVVDMKDGAKMIMLLFGLTIATAVSFHQFLHLPPMLGMMTGLGYLKIMGFYLKKKAHRLHERTDTGQVGDVAVFDVFAKVARAEWDTLLFFYGVVLSVGGLGFMGYLALVSEIMYLDMGPTTANVLVGFLSAIVDNIPVMFAVLTMQPDMSDGQWLLVTLTAGVGGSMLSIGSAAGVALMGQARGMYTFGSHLKWAPAIALGYAASIYTHIWVNGLQ